MMTVKYFSHSLQQNRQVKERDWDYLSYDIIVKQYGGEINIKTKKVKVLNSYFKSR